MKKQYRIIGRFVKDEKSHVVDWNWSWTKEDAERRLKDIIAEQERARKRGCYTQTAGCIGIDTPYYSEYELVDLQIQSREVSPWANVEE